MGDDFWGTWDGDYHYHAPALEFEDRIGIAGVGRRYAMPPDHDMESLEHEIKRRIKWCAISLDERLKRAQDYADILTRLNPELQKTRYDRDDLTDVWHFLLGVTSGFNPDDIDFFINADREELRSGRNNDKVTNVLSATFNDHARLGWRPSAPTADLIIRKLADKKKNPPSPPRL